MTKVTSKQSAFTIVELLVVIVVIGILAAITIVSFTGISQKATVSSIQSDLSSSSTMLKMYYAEYGYYPKLDSSSCPTAPSVVNSKYCLKYSSNNTRYAYSFTDSTFSLSIVNGATIWNISQDGALFAGAPQTVPSEPISLTVTPGCNSAQPIMTVRWTTPSSNGGSSITNYNIYRGTTSGGEVLLTTIGNLNVYVNNISNGTYYYQVSAVNSVGEGAKSIEVSATKSGICYEAP